MSSKFPSIDDFSKISSNNSSRRNSSIYDLYRDDIFLFNFINKFNNPNEKFKRRYSQQITNKNDIINKDVLDLQSGSRASYYSQFTLNLDTPFEARGKRIRSGSRTPTTTKLPPLDLSSRNLNSSHDLTDRLSASLKSNTAISKPCEPISFPSTNNKKQLPKKISFIKNALNNTENCDTPSTTADTHSESGRASNSSLASFMTPRGSTYQLPHTPVFRTRAGSIPNSLKLSDEPKRHRHSNKNKENRPNENLENNVEALIENNEELKIEVAKLKERKVSEPVMLGTATTSNRIVNNSLYKRLLAIHENTLKNQLNNSKMDGYEEDFNEEVDSIDENDDDNQSQVSSTSTNKIHRSVSLPANDRLNTIDESAQDEPKCSSEEPINQKTTDVITEVKEESTQVKPVKPIQTNTMKKTVNSNNKKAATTTAITTTPKKATTKPTETKTKPVKEKKTDTVKPTPKKQQPKVAASTEPINANEGGLEIVGGKLFESTRLDPSQIEKPEDQTNKRPNTHNLAKKVSFDQNLEITSSKIELKAKEAPDVLVSTQELNPQNSQKSQNYLQSMTMFYDRTETKIYEMFDNFPHPLAATKIPTTTTKKFLRQPQKYAKKKTTTKSTTKKTGGKKIVKSKKSKKNSKNEDGVAKTENDYNDDFEAESSAPESEISIDSTTTKSGVSVADVNVSSASVLIPSQMMIFNNYNQIPIQQQTDEISQKFLYSKKTDDLPLMKKVEIAPEDEEDDEPEPEAIHQQSGKYADDKNEYENTEQELANLKIAEEKLRSLNPEDSINSNSISGRSVRSNSNIHGTQKNHQSLNDRPPRPKQIKHSKGSASKQFQLPESLSKLIDSLPNTGFIEESNVDELPPLPPLPSQPNDDPYTSIRYVNDRISVTIKNNHVLNNVSLDSVGSDTVKSNNSVVEDTKPDNTTNYAIVSRNDAIASARKSFLSVQNYNEFPYKWRKGHLLGRGAFGTVYQALLSNGAIIAIKEVEMEETDPVRARKDYETVKDEINILSGLDHMNIVKFMGTSLESNIVNIFMEFIPGGTIESLLKTYGPFDETLFRNFANQIVEGVYYIHSNNVVHRDIKGRNIMLMPNGIIKLIDFGCAKRLKKNQSSNSTKHLLKSLKGTPYWMAPEVIRETGHGSKADIWSIGCTVFEMATGQPPWSDMKPIAAIYAIGSGEIEPPSLPSDRFSVESVNFVRACLNREQEYRPTAKELLSHEFFKMLSVDC